MPTSCFLPRALFITLLFLLPSSPLCAQEARAPFKLTAVDVEDSAGLDEAAWAYRMGDDGRWAAKDFDDSAWPTKGFDELVAGAGTSPAGERWDGAAWFRLTLEAEDALVNRPLALRVWHWGASEIYIDGNLLRRFGVIETDRDVERNPRGLPLPFVFTEGGRHTIAIRYSFKAARDTSSGIGRWLMRGNSQPGIGASIRFADTAVERYVASALSEPRNRLYVGILVALALLHFLLYVFYRRERANLFYSLFALSVASTTWLNFHHQSGSISGPPSAIETGTYWVLFIIAFTVAMPSLLAFHYVAFGVRFSKWFWAIVALWAVTAIVACVYVRQNVVLYLLSLGFALTLIDAIRIMVGALIRRRAGAWIIMTGLLLFTAAVCEELWSELTGTQVPDYVDEAAGYGIRFAVPLAVSVYLARNFARTNQDLEAQLANVKELSARQLEHERTEAELRFKHEQERAENERRAKELEEARGLQLSMLPARVPQLPELEIAAYMKPATEVGGDYYDFHLGDDGTLTIAVGDATGHGLKAGSVVTATKSLFNAFAGEENIPWVFKQTSQALKKMNLRGLFMAMTMLKVKDRRLVLCTAGMPATLLYRANTKRVEEIVIRAMPLGSITSFEYQAREIALSIGDCIVVLSDGFPEMFNEQNEMLDYAQAGQTLAEVATQTPQEIINRFVEVGEAWAGARAQDDDVTFVVLKVKAGRHPSR